MNHRIRHSRLTDDENPLDKSLTVLIPITNLDGTFGMQYGATIHGNSSFVVERADALRVPNLKKKEAK